jgi:hypothetical protein
MSIDAREAFTEAYADELIALGETETDAYLIAHDYYSDR